MHKAAPVILFSLYLVTAAVFAQPDWTRTGTIEATFDIDYVTGSPLLPELLGQ